MFEDTLTNMKNYKDYVKWNINNYNSYKATLNRRTYLLKLTTTIWDKLFGETRDKFYSYIIKRLSKEFKDEINEYKNIKWDNKKNNSKNIWTCWLQGKENMPTIVKKCYENICSNFKDYNIHLITYDNYMEYIDIPKHILDKVDTEKISKTHFSDIIRIKLLKQYGGYWIDSTLFSTSSKPLPIDNFTSIKTHYCWPGTVSNNWNVYFMGGENNPLFCFLDDCFTSYFKKYECVFDYFWMDYFIGVAYHNINYVKSSIDNIKFNNENVEDLVKYFNSPFNAEIYNKLISSNQFFKLTYKKQFEKTVDGQDTFYKKLIIK